MEANLEKIHQLVSDANKVVVIQADNPDGDSLASALALEEVLSDLGKEVHLYCGVDISDYLKHISGWDRVSKEIPTQFDLTILVDCSALVLLQKLESSPYRSWVASRPMLVLDHHADVVCDIPYATTVVNDATAVATGELIYKIATELKWPVSLAAKTHIASSILADSLGLSSEGTTSSTYRIMADLIDGGVSRPALEEARRALTKMPEQIFRYKAKLINTTELHDEGRIAIVTIPHDDLMTYSALYNPGPLIQNDLLQIEGVKVAVVLKHYKDGKITGSIRCGFGVTIAADLATKFGGGGHIYAAGFKVTDGTPYSKVKQECIETASELLHKVSK